jgi:predicted nucleic-acid-binding protein
MRAVDTNVVVRLIVRDDPVQAGSADAFVSKGAWISQLALAETVWVLKSFYGLRPEQIATAVEMLLNHEHLTIQHAEVVAEALEHFRKRPATNFSDYLLVEIARKGGNLPLGTFDRDLARLDGTQRL